MVKNNEAGLYILAKKVFRDSAAQRTAHFSLKEEYKSDMRLDIILYAIAVTLIKIIYGFDDIIRLVCTVLVNTCLFTVRRMTQVKRDIAKIMPCFEDVSLFMDKLSVNESRTTHSILDLVKFGFHFAVSYESS